MISHWEKFPLPCKFVSHSNLYASINSFILTLMDETNLLKIIFEDWLKTQERLSFKFILFLL